MNAASISLLGGMVVASLLMVAGEGGREAWAAKPRRVQAPREVRVRPEVYLASPPYFLRPRQEEFFLAIEIPYDLFYLEGSFFLYSRGFWFASDFFEGPWERLEPRRTPASLRSRKIQELRELRDQSARFFAENPEKWPRSELFIPENIDNDVSSDDEEKDNDPLPLENDPPQETVQVKGEK